MAVGPYSRTANPGYIENRSGIRRQGGAYHGCDQRHWCRDAKRLAELGAKVGVTGRRRPEGRQLVNEIKGMGGCAAFIQADLSRSHQVRRIVPFTVETVGRLDYAFNNAGTSVENRLLVDQTQENFDRVAALNVKALFLWLQTKSNKCWP